MNRILKMLVALFSQFNESEIPPETTPQIHCVEHSLKEKKWYYSLSAGYNWKPDHRFHKIYDRGALAFDGELGCWVNNYVALGVKSGYFFSRGFTVLLENRAKFWEVPIIAYAKLGAGTKNKIYLSLGTGVLFFNERSYLGKKRGADWGFEGEIGLESLLSKSTYLLNAFRYLYFNEYFSQQDHRRELGGFEYRIGIGTRF